MCIPELLSYQGISRLHKDKDSSVRIQQLSIERMMIYRVVSQQLHMFEAPLKASSERKCIRLDSKSGAASIKVAPEEGASLLG